MKDILKKLFESIDPQNSLIKEDVRASLTEQFESKMAELKEAAYKEALEKVDEEHCELLDKVRAKIDEDHCELLDKVLEKIDEEHTELLDQVVEKLRSEKLSESNREVAKYVSDFLDTYLDEAIPETTVKESVETAACKKIFEQIKQAMATYEVSIDAEINEAFLDGKQIIDEKEKELSKLMFEKIELKNELEDLKRAKIVEEQTKSMSPKLKLFVETQVKDAELDKVEEKIAEAVKAFDADEKQLRQKLNESADSKSKLGTLVPVSESTTDNVDPMMEMYRKMVAKSKQLNG
ncbi:MAG TPA: hypothetical protein PLA71_00920 [Saccharofermentans sp.]|nr:hypothetical protein [Saccharofermentans sp.]